jgi:DnaJ-class molecular chaperone
MRQHDAVVECCQVLGLQPRDALSREVIEKAYRKQAAKVHPDAHQARVRSTAHCQGTSDSTHAQVVDSDNHKSCSSPTETGSLSTGAAELQQQGVVQQGGSKVAAGQAGTSASKVKEAAEHQFIRVHEARQMLLDLLKL